MIDKIKNIKRSRLPKHIIKTYDIINNLYKISEYSEYKYYYNDILIAKTMYTVGIILVNEKLFTGYDENELVDIYNIIKDVLKIDNDIIIVRQMNLQ